MKNSESHFVFSFFNKAQRCWAVPTQLAILFCHESDPIPWEPLVLPREQPASLLPVRPSMLETSQPPSYPAEAGRQTGVPHPLAEPPPREQCSAVPRQQSVDLKSSVDQAHTLPRRC